MHFFQYLCTQIKEPMYTSLLKEKETEHAIKLIKDTFQSMLATSLKLRRVTAPLFVQSGLGINDDLNGIERAVSFPIKDMNESVAEVVHSLAKWKRVTLAEYQVDPGFGIITDMNAIRADEELDNIHSLYVDQWDWERVITKEQRNLEYLKKIVRRIYEAIKVTENKLYVEFPLIEPMLPEDIFFVHSEDLLKMYPDMSSKDRENAIVKKHKAVFIIGIGGELSDGTVHDGRAADYDDWTTRNEDGFDGLNGDLMLWNPVLNSAFEVSSMGIRVDDEALRRQLKMRAEEWKSDLMYHRMLLDGELPYTIGGGIGQSRLCMFLLRKAHIGEIQSSIWPDDMREACHEVGIELV